MDRRTWIVALACLALAGCEPRRSGLTSQQTTTEPILDGRSAAVPIEPKHHIRNTGGSDKAGLCVGTSIAVCFNNDGAYVEAQKLLAYLRQRPGGSYPEKLERDFATLFPDVEYVSIVGTDYTIPERLIDAGIPFGMTMGYDDNIYGRGKEVQHMVTWIDFDHDADLACYIDNNAPGKYQWCSIAEAKRKAQGTNGHYWLFAVRPKRWIRMAKAGLPSLGAVVLCGAVLVVAIKRREEA